MSDTPQTMPQIGDTAPEFYASSTNGTIHFPHDFMGKWVVFFSHPSDFTPVCTTEFIQFQHDINEFKKINAQLVGMSVGALSSHLGWLDAIEKMPNGAKITFPLIDDLNMHVAKLYDMIHPHVSDTHAVRSVFIIDSKSVIRAILIYPAILGRNIEEIKRMVTALQTADKFGVAIPANWTTGDDVLSPAPNTAVKMRKNKTPWFLTYKKLSKREIHAKIQNKTETKK